MKRTLLLLLSLALPFAFACSDVTAPPPAPAHPVVVVQQAHFDVIAPNPDGTCKSGYSQASGRNGEIICVKDENTETVTFRRRQ